MSPTRIKEFSTGKLYISEEAERTEGIRVSDAGANTVTIMLGEAITMSEFPGIMEENLRKQIAFLSACRSAGILPDVRIYELSPQRPGDASKMLLITGRYEDQIRFEEMFYLPEAESIFRGLFNTEDWSILNARSSVGNVARKGFGISSLESFDDLLRKIKGGTYFVASMPGSRGGTQAPTAILSGPAGNADQQEPRSARQPPEEPARTLQRAGQPSGDAVRPGTVSLAVVLGYVAAGVMVISAAVSAAYVSPETFVPAFAIGCVLAMLRAVFIFLCSHRKNWARIVYGLIWLLDISSLFRQPAAQSASGTSVLPDILFGTILMLESAAVVLLFVPGSSRWFRVKHPSPGVVAETAPEGPSDQQPAPRAVGAGIPKFIVTSQQLTQSHEYGSESSRKRVTASDRYRLLVTAFKVCNDTENTIGFSSQQFSVLDRQGRSVNASFFGIGDSIAESGAVMSTEGKVNAPDGSTIVTYKGKLSVDVSFMEWTLGAHRTYEDTIVFLVPADAQEPRLHLS